MLREESSVTVRLPVMLIVLKFAVFPAPVAMILPLHRFEALQVPFASEIHVPLAVVAVSYMFT